MSSSQIYVCKVDVFLTISDANPGKTLTKDQRENRVLEWRHLKQEENKRLQEESKKFSDVHFVPNVDVYRNLPTQLLEFYRWYEISGIWVALLFLNVYTKVGGVRS